MARYSFDLLMHKVHTLLQGSPRKGMWMTAGAGLGVAVAVIATIALPKVWSADVERQGHLAALAQTNETIDKLQHEKAAQQAALQKLRLSQGGTQKASPVGGGGYSESDVAYWRTQMSAFGEMTGVRMNIVGRGSSHYIGATRLTVSLKADAVDVDTPIRLLKALDFLQVYGYVESFNGTEAVVHVAGEKS